MKKALNILFVFIFILSPELSSAASYRESRPEAIAAIQTQGVGAVYNIRLASDGNIRRIRVTDYKVDPKTGELTVYFKRADNLIIVEYEDRQITFEADSGSTNTNNDVIHGQKPNGPEYGDWSVGLDAGGMAAIQYLLLEDSQANKDINEAYKNINRLQQGMVDMWSQVQQAQIDLTDNIIALDLRMQSKSLGIEETVSRIGSVDRNDILAFGDRSDIDLQNLKWLSQNEDFVGQANEIRNQLLQSKVNSPVRRSFYDISKHALIWADRASYLGDHDEAQFLLGIAKTTADVLVGVDPFTGFARSAYEVFTGKNLITGAELTQGERILAGLGVLTAGYAITTTKAFKAMLPIARKLAPAAMETFNGLKSFFAKTGNGFQLVDKGSEVRKINLRSTRNPNWGFRPKHLTKHFFGNGGHSLNMIDPTGNTDLWMKNIMDVVQRPTTSINKEGIIDIIHTYEKADKSGTYKLGVRLAPNQDKSYDLVTVLTRQGN